MPVRKVTRIATIEGPDDGSAYDIYDGVAPEITDAVTNTGNAVVGSAGAVAMGSLYQTIGNSLAMAAMNSVNSQQQATMTFQTASATGVTKLLKLF